MKNKPPEYLLTYGTLQKGNRNDWRLLGCPFIGKAVTAERLALYNMGLYPGATAPSDEPAHLLSNVHGELYQVNAKAIKLNDKWENVPRFYVRVKITVDVVSGEKSGHRIESWVYLMNKWLAKGGFIEPSGIWREKPELVKLSGMGYKTS